MFMACANSGCANHGAVYHGDTYADCPICGKTMKPAEAPPEPEPPEHEDVDVAAQELDQARLRMGGFVLGLLDATDKWAARAYEDGEPMSGARKAYRQALRTAYQKIVTSDDPESVTLPEPPTAE